MLHTWQSSSLKIREAHGLRMRDLSPGRSQDGGLQPRVCVFFTFFAKIYKNIQNNITKIYKNKKTGTVLQATLLGAWSAWQFPATALGCFRRHAQLFPVARSAVCVTSVRVGLGDRGWNSVPAVNHATMHHPCQCSSTVCSAAHGGVIDRIHKILSPGGETCTKLIGLHCSFA